MASVAISVSREPIGELVEEAAIHALQHDAVGLSLTGSCSRVVLYDILPFKAAAAAAAAASDRLR